MKRKQERHSGVRELCSKLKLQLDELAVTLTPSLPSDEQARRLKLMERLRDQLAELSR